MHTATAEGRRTAPALIALVSLIAALVLIAAPAMGVTYATITGYADGSATNNSEETWEAFTAAEDECTKSEPGGTTYELPVLGDGLVYTLVIVKAGSDVSTDGHANTLFANPSAGQTVFGDSNGSGAFDDGDKIISHLIVCIGEADTSQSQSQSQSQSASASASTSQSQEQSVSASQSASVSVSASQSAEQSVEGNTGTPEQSVQGGTGSPAASMGNGSVSSQGTSSAIPAIAFGILALASLGGLAAVNLASVRRRS